MRLLRPKVETAEPVTRAEMDALSQRLEASLTVSALAFAAIAAASQAPPGFPAANPELRLRKLAAAVDLNDGERAALASFAKLLDRMGKTEGLRETAETIKRTSPDGLIERLRRPPRM
jgi:hypothetical protein